MKTVFQRGLVNDYTPHTELTNEPHGHIDIARSIKQGTVNRGKLFCDFEMYDSLTYQNSIINSVIRSMIECSELNKANRSELKVFSSRMNNIPTVPLANIKWNLAEYRGRSKEYRMALKICRLFTEALLPSDGGSRLMKGFISSLQEHKLFEEFVRGYFKIEYPEIFDKTRWMEWAVTGESSDFLPGMEMDLLLKKGNRVLIVDTKYYGSILSGRKSQNVLNSSNLYQINAYIQNRQFYNPDEEISGMLLYAKASDDFNSCHNDLLGHRIYSWALDCDGDWSEIDARLRMVAEII